MPDEIQTATPAASPELQAFANAIGHDVTDVKAALAAYKAGGKAALLASLPNLVSDVKDTFMATKAELPEIKSGFKTSEFWLAAGFVITSAVFIGWTGHALPDSVNYAIGGVVAVYAAVRALLKKPAVTAS